MPVAESPIAVAISVYDGTDSLRRFCRRSDDFLPAIAYNGWSVTACFGRSDIGPGARGQCQGKLARESAANFGRVAKLGQLPSPEPRRSPDGV